MQAGRLKVFGKSCLLGRNTRSKERIYDPSPSLEAKKETLKIKQEVRKEREREENNKPASRTSLIVFVSLTGGARPYPATLHEVGGDCRQMVLRRK